MDIIDLKADLQAVRGDTETISFFASLNALRREFWGTLPKKVMTREEAMQLAWEQSLFNGDFDDEDMTDSQPLSP